MEFTRPGKPAFGQGIHSVPGDAMRLAAPDHGPWPEPDHPFATDPEAVQVPRYRVVVELALHHRLEPLPSLRTRIMHSLAQLLLDAPQFCPHAFADRPAPDLEGPIPEFPANVGGIRPGESPGQPGEFRPEPPPGRGHGADRRYRQRDARKAEANCTMRRTRDSMRVPALQRFSSRPAAHRPRGQPSRTTQDLRKIR